MSQSGINAAYHIRNAKVPGSIEERADDLIKTIERLIAAVAALEKE